MLTKTIGSSTVVTMTGTPQTVYLYTNLYGSVAGQSNVNLPVNKVRVATAGQPAYIAFGTSATTATSILIPANYVEHFKIESYTTSTTSTAYNSRGQIITTILTATVSVLQAGTGGAISVTPVA
jgi:hypothetical protein